MVEEESTVNQPGSPRPQSDDAAMLAPNQSVVEETNPHCLESAPSAIIAVKKSAIERLDSFPHESDSLTLVVMDEPGAERPILPRMLTAGFGERHQRHLYETIELSGSSAPRKRSEGAEPVAIREDPSEPTLMSDNESPGDAPLAEGGAVPAPMEEPVDKDSADEDSANEVDNIFVRLPSCVEMEEMLMQIPRGSDVDLSPSQMFEAVEMVTKFTLFVLNA